jgi:hypothetical protein
MQTVAAVRAVLTGVAVVFGVGMLAPSAQADTASFTIGIPNSFLTGTGPYATLTVDRTSTTTATITFSSLNNGGFEYLMGDGDSVAINVNSTSWTIQSFSLSSTNSFSGFSLPTLTDAGAQIVASFGSFNQAFNSSGTFTNSSTSITFVLVDNIGTWATAASVLTPNGDGFVAAIHAFECANPCTATEGVTATGFAVDGVTAVPLPAALPLFASGLGALGLLGWRRKRKALAA